MERRDSALDVVLVAGKVRSTPPLSPRLATPELELELHHGLAEQQLDVSQPQPTTTTSCLLDRLPDELLLIIWEYAVVEPEPLYINCPCDSSFGGWNEHYYAEREAWEEGARTPPWQPGLTRVCRAARADALPMFYKYNQFRAGYCYECDTDIVIAWLKVIGAENRAMLEHFFFWDENPDHDRYSEKCLKKLKRSAVLRELGGRMESSYTSKACRHDVTFGDEGDFDELEGMAEMFEHGCEGEVTG